MAELAVGEYVALAEGVYLEGLAVDHQRGVIWYSDVIAGGIRGKARWHQGHFVQRQPDVDRRDDDE